MSNRQSFIVLVRGPGDYEERAFGIYRSFKRAENDAKAIQRHDRHASIIPIEPIEDLP